MPQMTPQKIAFLDAEISGLRSRIGDRGNAVQHAKLQMLRHIREDYRKSADADVKSERGGQA